MKSNLFIILVTINLLTECAKPISENHYIEPQDKQRTESLDEGDILIKLAEKKFGKLTEADKILFSAVADGTGASYWERRGKNKPEDANSWGEKRIIDANRIEWLCRDRKAKEIVTDKGIQIIGAKITGVVDLSFIGVPFPLVFWGCLIEKGIDLKYSNIKLLALDGTHIDFIHADGSKIENNVFLREGFTANGEIHFPEAIIGGSFDCRKGKFIKKDGYAIIADRIDVRGSVILNNEFKTNGEVEFIGAKIGGDFDCQKGEFNKFGSAIKADRINVIGSVLLRNYFNSKGEVCFARAQIGGDFNCENGDFNNEGGAAIVADGINVKGSIFLRNNFKSKGEIRFPGARINGQFNCSNSDFNNAGKTALFAEGMDIKGGVFLNDVNSYGTIKFSNAIV